MDDLVVISRFVHFTATALLFGRALFKVVVRVPETVGVFERRGRQIDLGLAVLALVSALGWLAGVAATMAGSWDELGGPDTAMAIIRDTRFGRVAVGRFALIAVILAMLVTKDRAKPTTLGGERALLALSAILLASLVGWGHGLSGESVSGAIHAVADIVHLLCAGAWLGGLLSLGLIIGHARRSGIPSWGNVNTSLIQFSRLGYLAVGLLIVTGCINTLAIAPDARLIIDTDYGRILAIKIALVAMMVGLAVVNRLVLLPKMGPGDSAAKRASGAFLRSITIEQLIGLAILAVVARLGMTHPF